MRLHVLLKLYCEHWHNALEASATEDKSHVVPGAIGKIDQICSNAEVRKLAYSLVKRTANCCSQFKNHAKSFPEV